MDDISGSGEVELACRARVSGIEPVAVALVSLSESPSVPLEEDDCVRVDREGNDVSGADTIAV